MCSDQKLPFSQNVLFFFGKKRNSDLLPKSPFKVLISAVAPFYGSGTASLQDQVLVDLDDDDEVQAQSEASAQLYRNIQALTDQAHSELDTMIDLDTITSRQSTPGSAADLQLPIEPPPELYAHTDLNVFTTERNHSAMNAGNDPVRVLDDEDDIPAAVDSTSTLSASSEPSNDPKMKKAIEKMKRLDDKLADLDKVRVLAVVQCTGSQ